MPTYGGLAVWELEKDGKPVDVRVEGQAIFNTTFLVLDAALDGLGIAYVPLRLAQPHFGSGRLVPLLKDWWVRYDAYLYDLKRRQRLNRPGFPGGSFTCEDGAMRKAPTFSPEVQERAVRRVLEHQGEHGSQWAAIASVAGKMGCTAEAEAIYHQRSRTLAMAA